MEEHAPDDVEFEANDESNQPLGAQAKVKQLRQELKEALAKRDEYLAGWQREKADAVNSRREALLEADRRALRAKERLLEDFLPALDSFDMATGSESWAQVGDGFRSGMEAVRNQLLEALSKNGVERYGRVGEQFDPRMHEIVQEMDGVPGQQHEVVKILRFGYKLGDRILRPAQVIIRK